MTKQTKTAVELIDEITRAMGPGRETAKVEIVRVGEAGWTTVLTGTPLTEETSRLAMAKIDELRQQFDLAPKS